MLLLSPCSLQGAGASGPTTADEPARELPVFLDARAQAGKAKRKLSMQCQVLNPP